MRKLVMKRVGEEKIEENMTAIIPDAPLVMVKLRSDDVDSATLVRLQQGLADKFPGKSVAVIVLTLDEDDVEIWEEQIDEGAEG